MRPAFPLTPARASAALAWPRRCAATALVLGCAVFALPPAHAAAPTAGPVPSEVRGIALDSICAACGVVSDVHGEVRDAPGAVKAPAAGGLLRHRVATRTDRVTVWLTTVTFKDGSVRTYPRTSGQAVEPGDVVVIVDGQPTRVGR